MSDDLVKHLRNSKGWPTLGNLAADRIEELEAKLAKAVEALGTALDEMVDYADTHPAWEEIWEAREAARSTLAEIGYDKRSVKKGEK